jgi:hypothetical protein
VDEVELSLVLKHPRKWLRVHRADSLWWRACYALGVCVPVWHMLKVEMAHAFPLCKVCIIDVYRR